VWHPRRKVIGVSSEQDLPMRFAVVDVETSGLNVARHRLLQVGVVRVDAEGVVIDRWSSLVRPRHRWCFRVGPRRLHGIRHRSLLGAPRARDVHDELVRRLEGCVVVAHNASFDLAFLHDFSRRLGRSLPVHASLCTLSLSRQLDPERTQSHRLAALCERYDVPLVRPHDALADADATAAVLVHLLAAHRITTPAQVEAQLVAA
jgi:DNA polymerase III subunit epsilon